MIQLLQTTNYQKTPIRLLGILLPYVCVLFSSTAFCQVNANFSASPVAGCAPLIVQFQDISTGNPNSWSWNFGNGNTSTSQNPATIYSNPGVYTVTLTVTNGAFSDTEIKTNYILVYNKPAAGFTISSYTACVGQTVTFTDATVISPGGPNISHWSWDFGDGNSTTTTTTTVTHTYNTPGTYPVSVIVTDPNGCSGTITQNIVVVPAPSASFSATPTSACAPPLNVTFTNTSSTIGSTTYTWNFGDGNTATGPNPFHTYTASGSYNVTLIVNQNGCIDSVTINNYVTIQKITANFAITPPVTCTGQQLTFNNISLPTASTSTWTFGDGNNSNSLSPTHTYTAAGTYTVTLIAGDANGCLDTATGAVTVHQTPNASFSADTMVACNVPFTVNFTNTSTGGNTYFWNFGDGSTSTLQNPVHTYTAAGTYPVSLIVTNNPSGCSDTIVMNNFIVISPPIAGFSHIPDSGCVPLTVNFNSTSTSAIDPIATYSWSFGDGSNLVTTTPNVSHTYTATGIYSVTLIIQTQNGCSDTIVCSNCIKVGTPPVAGFTILDDTVCYGLPVFFTDTSVGNVTGWYWVYGDGGTGIQQNPQYTYGDTGTFAVYLVAYHNGCTDTSLIDSVTILPPIARMSYTLSCTDYYTVQFLSTSAGADSIFWDFGDGTLDSSNNISPVHTYPSRGPFTVTLIAYNYNTGCSNTVTATFTIAEPIANYTVNPPGCYPHNTTFTSTSQDANAYWWNFGDPSTNADTSILANPSYVYNLPGAYTVTLIITDVNGCRDTITDTVKSLGPIPYFYADTLTGCTPFSVTFIDTSYSDSLLTQWIWNFGDGSPPLTTNNDSVTHIYTFPGIYSVTMTVTDNNGCAKTIIKTNYVQPTFPFPAFTVDTFACKFDVLTYDASATNAVGGTFIWDYGDGTQDTTTSPIITHSYSSDGLYIVSLTVVDANGCDSTITDTIRILKPTANFGWSLDTMYCGQMVINFTDSSTGFITNWMWYFGDGGTSTLQNPSHVYQVGGIYSVTLAVTNAGGCMDTIVLDSIITVPFATGDFTLTPASGCNPLTVCFDVSALNTSYYIWDFGDGTVLYSNGDTCHTYTTPGTFNPILLLSYTLPTGVPCIQQANNLTGPVVVTNVINVSLSGPTVIMLPEDSIISVTANFSGGVGPYTYNWSPSMGINCTNCTNVLIIGTGDTIVYTFTVYDSSGCIGIDSVIVLSTPCFEEKLIPNIFTPNGDGWNDIFYVPGVCPSENYSLQIFDRWGVLIFSTTLRNNGWDGRNNSGVEVSEGTYYYVITLSNLKNIHGAPLEDKVHKGFVTLIR